MLDSLIKAKFNWTVFVIFALIFRLTFVEMSWYSFFALMISLHQFTLLFNSLGHVIPVRYLFGSFMCLQMFVGPALAYNGLDQYQYIAYKMAVPEFHYFSYTIPAVLCFIIGLHTKAGLLKGEFVDQEAIARFVQQNRQLPYIFIGIGFVSSIAAALFGSSFGFVFYLLGSFKFIGAFLIILGSQRLKPLPLILVYGSIIVSSLGSAMFHDLLTWLIFLGAVFSVKYKPSIGIKALLGACLLLIAVVIQQLKGQYREATGRNKEERGLETFTETLEAEQEKDNVFSFVSLAQSNVRINQGFIVTNIMKTVPNQVPFENGKELMVILEAAFLPRILAPDKLRAGDNKIFTKYSGIQIREDTSMGLSSIGDAYINFGIFGGSIFMFFLGLLYSEVLKLFDKHSKTYPVLILFTALVFYYPIRPDCELQTILGHLVKSCFLIYIMIQVWKKDFKIWPTTSPQFSS